MEGYGGDGGSQRVSQGEWLQNSEWMHEMAAPIFRPHYSISEMFQDLVCFNLLVVHFFSFSPNSSSYFHY